MFDSEFNELTPIGSFTLFIEGRYAGDYFTPLPLVGNMRYFCRFCGEVFALRLVAGNFHALWDYESGVCRVCDRSRHNGAYQSFRTSGEEALGFAPARLLAEEFLFNSKEYANGNATIGPGTSASIDSAALDAYVERLYGSGPTTYQLGASAGTKGDPVR